jgi:hypothetical protein
MNDAGMSSFTVELTTASANVVGERLEELTSQLDQCALGLREYATTARNAVHEQEKILPELLRPA